MPVLYRKSQFHRDSSENDGKWYGRAVSLNTVTTKDLAGEIEHATTVSYADIIAVLAELSHFIKNHLQASEIVELDGIGTFKVGLKTKFADTEAEFNNSKIVGYRIIYNPESKFTKTGMSEKGNATGFYTDTLLAGISAKLAPAATTAGTEDDTEKAQG